MVANILVRWIVYWSIKRVRAFVRFIQMFLERSNAIIQSNDNPTPEGNPTTIPRPEAMIPYPTPIGNNLTILRT